MRKLPLLVIIFAPVVGIAQEIQNPIIKNFGGIYNIEQATIKTDPDLDYKIVIDINTGSDNPSQLNPSLINVARLVNLHGAGGVPKEKLHVVLAVHATSTYALMDNESFRAKYAVDNPNLPLIAELIKSGVRVVVCGQSLVSRNVDPKKLAPGVEIGISMLTTVSTCQLNGYAYLKF